MGEPIEAKRRDFLKSSLLLGAASAAPAIAQQAPKKQVPSSQAPGPTATAAHAEAGAIGAEADPDPNPDRLKSDAGVIEYPGSDFMVDVLQAAGIKYMAAMVGASFRGLHESVLNYGHNKAPELIVCVHEEVSAGIAHGYAKVAGKPIAIAVHNIVGLQHASMAIYNAWCDRAPMLVLVGNTLDETKRRPGVEYFHTAEDVGSMVRDFVKWDDNPVSLQHFAESTIRAVQLAMTPPYEPVLLSVDSEMQEEAVHNRGALKIPKLMPVAAPAGEPAAIAAAADMLIAAEHPLIVADRAARTPVGFKRMVELAELLQAPVIDISCRLNFPTNHYLNHTTRQSVLVKQADVILGLELTDIWGVVNNVPDKIVRKSVRLADPQAKVIGIASTYGFIHGNVQDSQRAYSCDLTLASDAEACLPQLIEAVTHKLTPARRRELAKRKPVLEDQYKTMRAADAAAAAVGWDASPVSTARLSMELWQKIKGTNWSYVSETKFLSSWPHRLWDFTEHHQYIGGSGGYGLGYGLPAALGAAIAHRDAGRYAVAILGDGDVMMLPGAFWTAAHHSIPILMIMHNNRAWHQETMHLRRMSSRRNRGPESWNIGTTITDPAIDFASIAKAQGVWAEGPIDDPNALGAAIDRALAVVRSGKPALLDVLTQPR